MKDVQMGYQLSSITPFLGTEENIRDSFRKIADIRYRYVQLQGVPVTIDDNVIASALHDTGLVCVGTQEDYILGFGDDPGRYIARAKAVGATYLAVALIPFELNTIASIKDFAREKLLPCVRAAEKEGLVFSFHPIGYDYRLVEGKPAYEILMDALPESVHLTFCVSACFESTVRPEDVFAKYGDRMEMTHFKDYLPTPDGKQQLMPLGQGTHEWMPYAEACRESSSVRYIFGEQERWLKDAFECAKDTFDYMKGLGL